MFQAPGFSGVGPAIFSKEQVSAALMPQDQRVWPLQDRAGGQDMAHHGGHTRAPAPSSHQRAKPTSEALVCPTRSDLTPALSALSVQSRLLSPSIPGLGHPLETT